MTCEIGQGAVSQSRSLSQSAGPRAPKMRDQGMDVVYSFDDLASSLLLCYLEWSILWNLMVTFLTQVSQRWWMPACGGLLFLCAGARVLEGDWVEAVREAAWAALVLGWTWP